MAALVFFSVQREKGISFITSYFVLILDATIKMAFVCLPTEE